MTRIHSRQRRGGATLELAILLPFLGLMFTATVDFARAYQAAQTLQECARAGALYASGTARAPSATGAARAATNAACASGVSLSPPVQATDVTVTTDSAASTATVTVTWTFSLITPLPGSGSFLQMRRSVTMNQAPTPGS